MNLVLSTQRYALDLELDNRKPRRSRWPLGLGSHTPSGHSCQYKWWDNNRLHPNCTLRCSNEGQDCSSRRRRTHHQFWMGCHKSRQKHPTPVGLDSSTLRARKSRSWTRTIHNNNEPEQRAQHQRKLVRNSFVTLVKCSTANFGRRSLLLTTYV